MVKLNAAQMRLGWYAVIGILLIELGSFPTFRPFINAISTVLFALVLAACALKLAIWRGWIKLG